MVARILAATFLNVATIAVLTAVGLPFVLALVVGCTGGMAVVNGGDE